MSWGRPPGHGGHRLEGMVVVPSPAPDRLVTGTSPSLRRSRDYGHFPASTEVGGFEAPDSTEYALQFKHR